MPDKYIIYTWGCQMNEEDSRQIADSLKREGFTETEDPAECTVAVLVTCSVRQKPENKVLSKLGELAIIKAEANPGMIIGVYGCMAQRQGKALRRGRPYINFVCGTHVAASIPALVRRSLEDPAGFFTALDLPDKLTGSPLPLPQRNRRISPALREFVPIMYGCNNFCSYCIVPYTRGRERSRPWQQVVDEIREMADNGTREVNLLGQNVNSYSGGISFPELLERVNRIQGLERIRFTTSHPKDLTPELIEAMGSLDKVARHIHLAVQSGDDEVLRAMNRKYDTGKIKSLVAALRERIGDVAITTDLIAGFPGETEEQFENTLRLVEEIRFDSAFMFSFNPIPGTPAAAMDGQMTMKEKNKRLERLIALQNSITTEINRLQEGRTALILVHGDAARKGQKTGLTEQGKVFNFEGRQPETGAVVRGRIARGELYGFSGVLDEAPGQLSDNED
ncbi:MAG: tRNA (N6-isopentenyl adenosine(37)-C2)-methylthiotransferase MiaB [Abditibacteriota bacterium]|nr:tRNA (N6-isopentenyl adenosine(37)-C2)-methylthiotransferase MiaB [Abditibacteriota bacterium]